MNESQGMYYLEKGLSTGECLKKIIAKRQGSSRYRKAEKEK